MTESEPLDPDAARFLEIVSAWLLAKKDPRLVLTETGWIIEDAAGACADFCGFMAEQAETSDPQ